MELYHHGIKGQKWGERNGPPYPLDNPFTKKYSVPIKSQHLDKWGSSPETNTLFVTGLSGSGKSTAAKNLADKNTNVIHLDLFMEPNNVQDGMIVETNDTNVDNEFVSFLNKKKFNISKLSDTTIDRKERWKYIDRFAEDLIPEFSNRQYKKGKKVVVEGVQLSDDTMYPDKSYFKNKPMVVVQTNKLKSMNQARKRDNAKWTIQDIKERLDWYEYSSKRMNEITKDSNFVKGKLYVDLSLGVKKY